MTDNKKPPIFTDDDRIRLNENTNDYDRHFLPGPEDQEDESTNDEE